MSGAPPSDPVAALSALAAHVLSLPHGAATPTVGLGFNPQAFDMLRACEGHRITQSKPDEQPDFRACYAIVAGVEFYAVDRVPR